VKRKASTSLSIYSLRVERSGQFFFFMLAHLHSFKKAPQPAKGIKPTEAQSQPSLLMGTSGDRRVTGADG